METENQDKIRQLLNEIVTTRNDLADSVGINYPNFTKFLKGKKNFSEENIEKCIAYLRELGHKV